jgi:CheY-like chemotaxis protein
VEESWEAKVEKPSEQENSERKAPAHWRTLATLGMLNAQVAHDFNNLLMVIAGHARMGLEEPGLKPAVRECLEEILDAAARGEQLSKRLLAAARRDTSPPRLLSWHELLRKLRPVLERLLGPSVQLEISNLAGDAKVYLTEQQAEQVVLNLVVNSRDALPLGGRIAVHVLAHQRDVDLVVEDNGAGIPAQILDKVFQPFVTSKGSGQGTGLGLALVRELAEEAGGQVRAENLPSGGARITLSLPLAHAAAPSAAAPSAAARILVVDDEPGIRKLICRALEAEGLAVKEAASATGALEAIAATPCDLLIADWELPDGSGRQIAAALLQKSPSAWTILISGYAIQAEDDFSASRISCLQKPFSTSTLVLEVRRVLGSLENTSERT